MPTALAYRDIFKRAAKAKGITTDEASLDQVLNKYANEQRPMKPCEPRDLLGRVKDLCAFEGRPHQLTQELIDIAWRNYFGAPRTFEPQALAVGQAQAVPVL